MFLIVRFLSTLVKEWYTVQYSMAKIIAIVNQKGGVGKTTTAVNLGAYLAHFGKSVLLIDLDPQANATSHLGVNARAVGWGVYEPLAGQAVLVDVIQRTEHDRFSLVPATGALAGATVELVPMSRREWRLHDIVQDVRDAYDYILIDCSPTLGLLTINGLVAADDVLIPVQAEYFALEGLSQLLETIDLIRENMKATLNILGAVITMYDRRYNLSQDVLEELYRFFPNKIFRSVIPRTIQLAEAPSYGKTILAHNPSSRGARAYEKLAREILMRENFKFETVEKQS